MYAAGADEDEVVFVEPDGRQRILRGMITNETKDSVTVSRRDGDHEIMVSTIRKIVRRSKRTGIVARAVDAVRSADEAEKAAAAKAFNTAILALLAARERDAPPEEIARLVDEVARARRAWSDLR